ncbi:hypothetical protein G436_0855 [Leptospira interrogans serovar Hardjo str. Norma]|uniref:Uncharacterized protein n=1 Tax=Leptospira interrogans serovar Hardjo str. Norma TaxID=1279460 RepID=A0A0M4MRU7_LEPIR|nr:hypothetical protein G436_0855 [Leptospira interrogans serovar Hardjo str. Norma]EKO98422.1 hypothetical protein LEP1GSC057_3916 [Leptospira interrogans str. Brem 329]
MRQFNKTIVTYRFWKFGFQILFYFYFTYSASVSSARKISNVM